MATSILKRQTISKVEKTSEKKDKEQKQENIPQPTLTPKEFTEMACMCDN